MVLRKRLIASLTTGLLPFLTASLSHALIIQPVQVKSAIGEPFYAEIAISDLGASTLQNISVGLASPQELSGLGIPAAHLPDLQFSVQQRSGSQGVIVVTGSQPVNDPFLEFVLKVKSGNNTRIQRVSALLDPQSNKRIPLSVVPKTQFASDDGFVQLATSDAAALPPEIGSSQAVTMAASSSPHLASEQPLVVLNSLPPDMQAASSLASTAVMDTKTQGTTLAVPQEIEVSTDATQQGRHVVRKNESLWKIANQLAPQMNQSVGQVMKTIRDMNKDAFIDGNPNQLRRGATLVLPERDQNTTLVNRALPAPAPVDHQKPLKSAASVAKKVTKRSGVLPKAELTIIAPTANGVALGNSNKGRTSGSQPLSRELAQKLGDERRKTVSMQHEVSQLDTQLTLNDKKIAMLNAKLAEMEQQLKMRNQKQKATKQTSATQKTLNALAPVLAVAALAVTGFSPNMAYAAEGDGGGFPMWIIPVAIIVVAAIAFLLMRGKSEDKKRAAAKSKRPASANRPNKPATPQEAAPAPQPRPVAAAPVAQTPVERKPVAPEPDVLQEVQSYIERERYTQALSLLKDATAKAPQRIDLQVKILEILALQNDIPAFDIQHKVINNFNQPDAMAHAEKLKQLLVIEKPKPDVEARDTIEFTPSRPHSDQVEPIGEEEDHSFFADDLQNNKAATAPAAAADDQSLEALEAEFGFLGDTAEQLKPSDSKPAQAQDNSFDFALENTTPAAKVSAEPSLDLEFDVSDAFTLEEVKQPAPVAFKQDIPASQPEDKNDGSNLDGITLDDTNWAEGFDDLEFDVGTTELPAAASVPPAPIQPAAELAETTSFDSTDPEDFLLKEFPFLVNIDVQQTNLELAESYINLGEARSARELLSEVINLGSSQQKAQAQHLLQTLPS